MTSDGERLDQHLQLVRLLMDRDGVDLDGALALAGALIPAGDHDTIRDRHRAQLSTTIQLLEPNALVDGGPRPWFTTHDTAQGYYWRRQRGYLAHTVRRKDYELDSLDLASDKVLSHLEDPHSLSPFTIRGLVVGHVQSGKTANFSALIAKAADAGYKVIIVMSGLHNTLRQQTQLRLERDLGREHVAGVGEPEPGRRWVWGTGSEANGDFSPAGFNAAVLQGNEQVILVVKKNKSRLVRLIDWMSGRVPAGVPVLIIDDEADQASVNTGGNREVREAVDLTNDDFDGDEPDEDELDPSAINLNVRKLLRLFARCSYVAYTATPFANVLINPQAVDRVAGADLFPSNFIISLPPPPGDSYVGAAELFGRDRLSGDGNASVEDGLDVIELVPDHEVGYLIPGPRQSGGFQPTMPPSMKQALIDFVLSAAARLQRSSHDEPCTMLIHTDMRRAMQNPIRAEVTQELAYIRQRWLYEAADFRPLLEARWSERFVPTTASVDVSRVVPFDDLAPVLDRLLRGGIDVRVLNSDWPDTANFDEEPTLKAVLIGGNKLSRGVTIEGLLVSYYVRETLYYDTLMQMGRWFGYRGDYVDLTRIYSTELLVSCFHDLATAEEELRRHIGRYERDGLTPTQFVPKVRTHPLMAVTQKSKMRDAVETSVNFAGQRVQTLRFPQGEVVALRANLEMTRRWIERLGNPELLDAQPTWSDVDPREVTRFISEFMLMPQTSIDPAAVVDYIKAQVQHRELVQWRVLLSCAKQPDDREFWHDDLGVAGLPAIPLIGRTRLKGDPTNLGVVTEPDDELLGLDDVDIRSAELELAERRFRSKAEAYRSMRPAEEGLLMLYPISPAAVPLRNSRTRIPLFPRPEDGATLIAYAVSFPFSDSEATVEYVSAPMPSPVS